MCSILYKICLYWSCIKIQTLYRTIKYSFAQKRNRRGQPSKLTYPLDTWRFIDFTLTFGFEKIMYRFHYSAIVYKNYLSTPPAIDSANYCLYIYVYSCYKYENTNR